MQPGDYVRPCPHCNADPTTFTERSRVQVNDRDGNLIHWHLATCSGCGGAIAMEGDAGDAFKRAVPQVVGDEWGVDHLEGDVAASWQEAAGVYRVPAYRSAVVMCGRTLEAAADARGIEGRGLQARIKRMIKEGMITTDFGDAMDYVRLIRNTGAHAGAGVSRESAEGTMRFTQQALRNLFEVPGELRRLREHPPELEQGEDQGGP